MPSKLRSVNTRLDPETGAILDALVARYSDLMAPVTASWVVVKAIRALAESEGIVSEQHAKKRRSK